jgi:hypothetical protein
MFRFRSRMHTYKYQITELRYQNSKLIYFTIDTMLFNSWYIQRQPLHNKQVSYVISLKIYNVCLNDIVTCIVIAKRLGKHIPWQANARNNRIFILGNGSVNTSLIIEAVSCMIRAKWLWTSVQQNRTEQETEVKSRVSKCQPAVIWAWEQRNWIDSSLRNWQLQNNGQKGIRRCKEDLMCDLKWQWDCYKSVARIRLLKIENPIACVTVKCKVCRSEIVLYLLVVLSCERINCNKSNHPNRKPVL